MKRMRCFSMKISRKQCSDSGMALILLMLLLGYFLEKTIFYELSIPLVVLLMVVPRAFYPFAFVWLGFSCLLGSFVPKIILSLIFFMLVLPVGLIRRMLGKDDLDLKKFGKDKSSVFHRRNKTYELDDIRKPY
ncbi:MAG: hypothetical protein K9G47_07005 [Bacteroidales bacterium]|nr:hypothetical protein [Bacteroidales bacterium]MCF8387614.1 hypothetical protein [Bacteroidales bacterium]